MSRADPAVDRDVLDRLPADEYRWLKWSLPADPPSVPFFRRWLRMILDDTVLDSDQVHDLLLAVGEAVSNAIEHAWRPTRHCVDMTVEVVNGRVTIVVQDFGAWRPGATRPHRGRGLAMLSALADTTVSSARSGTTVTIRGPSPGR